jgi:O-antigen/teichoic acid export membrane protein
VARITKSLGSVHSLLAFLRCRGDLIAYALATGVMRGGAILLMPLCLMVFSSGEYADYIIIVLLSKIWSRFITLSGSTAILKEGATSEEQARYLLADYSLVSVVLTLLSACCYLVVQSVYVMPPSFMLILPMALTEGLLQLKVHYFSSRKRHWAFLLISMYRLFVEMLLLVIVWHYSLGFTSFILLLCGAVWIVSLPHFRSVRARFWRVVRDYSYTIPVIPSTVLIWVLNSSDRLVMKSFLGDETVVKYSVGYNLASTVLLLTGTLAVWLPPRIFANYKVWIQRERQQQFFVAYSALAALCLIGSLVILRCDEAFTGWLRFYDTSVYAVLILAGLGCYFTGLMAYSSNILVYLGQTKILLLIDCTAALLNVAANCILIPRLGMVGAGVATLISFGSQFILSYSFAQRASRGRMVTSDVREEHPELSS